MITEPGREYTLFRNDRDFLTLHEALLAVSPMNHGLLEANSPEHLCFSSRVSVRQHSLALLQLVPCGKPWKFQVTLA
jgi:hypothetical protein